TQTQILADTGLVYVDGCGDALGQGDPTTCAPDYFPGTLWFRIQLGVTSMVLTAQSTSLTMNAPDSFRQDTTAPIVTTLAEVNDPSVVSDRLVCLAPGLRLRSHGSGRRLRSDRAPARSKYVA